ncbi:flagellar protein FliT [Lentisalinibacter salinarum]|uniref:flagellar protein FliT n=1 Tax=Lentisalinibacter salinarum TaxID=2992239 RepID=UPI003870DB2B
MTRALAEIESLSDEMRRCAGQGDWEAVEAALTARDGLVRELLAGPGAADHAEELRRLLDQDGEILALARKARDAVAAELRQLDNGRKAVQAYGGHNRQSRRSIVGSADSLDSTEA